MSDKFKDLPPDADRGNLQRWLVCVTSWPSQWRLIVAEARGNAVVAEAITERCEKPVELPQHHCYECGRGFTAEAGLRTHNKDQHGHSSKLRKAVDGTVCLC